MGIALEDLPTDAGGVDRCRSSWPTRPVFEPRRRLDRAMVSAAWEGAVEADAILLVVDARKKKRDYLEPILAALAERKERKILVLNKVDSTPKEPLLVMAEELSAQARSTRCSSSPRSPPMACPNSSSAWPR
jgi:GTP-binding protein Era